MTSRLDRPPPTTGRCLRRHGRRGQPVGSLARRDRSGAASCPGCSVPHHGANIAAAFRGVPDEEAWTVNRDAALELGRAAVASGLRRFVQVNTVLVYGAGRGRPAPRTTRPSQAGPCGARTRSPRRRRARAVLTRGSRRPGKAASAPPTAMTPLSRPWNSTSWPAPTSPRSCTPGPTPTPGSASPPPAASGASRASAPVPHGVDSHRRGSPMSRTRSRPAALHAVGTTPVGPRPRRAR